MAPLRLSLASFVLAAALTVSWHRHTQNAHCAEASELRAENARLRLQIVQQLEARLAKTGFSGKKTTAGSNSDVVPDKVTNAERRSKPTAENAWDGHSEYRNEGRATALAALQTFAWACDRGDVATAFHLIYFDEVARQKTMAYMASFPSTVRIQWPTPEAMAASLLTDDGIQDPYPRATILGLAKTEMIGDGRVVILMPGTTRDRIEFQQTREGWKYAVTEKMVDDYIAETNAKAQAKNGKGAR